MTATAPSPLEAFQWECQPAAEKLVRSLVEDFLRKNPFAANLADRMYKDGGVRFHDTVDTISLPATADLRAALESANYEKKPASNMEHYVQNEGIFPDIILYSDSKIRLSIKVEFASDFLATWQLDGVKINGDPLAPKRNAIVSASGNAELYIVERHGWKRLDFPQWSAEKTSLVLKHREALRTRKRDFGPDDDAGFKEAHRLIDAAIADFGVDYTCDLFFAAEREYWMRRNRAARVQFARQYALGIGWSNHDHHTYRASRKNFTRLVAMWEKLGFQLRERYHAGKQAGWGAQIMEQPNTGIVTFNDVDLTPDELFNDFAHEPLPEQKQLGTVGLWCTLHGDSFLQAGMHHLECMFDFNALRDQLEAESVKTMKPFTTFTYLRQAFTEGERWQVPEDRLARALSFSLITPDQAQTFRTQGAIGSHLENLERNQGFKGFNQTGVSEIISTTDPRKQVAHA